MPDKQNALHKDLEDEEHLGMGRGRRVENTSAGRRVETKAGRNK
jgi:hypothetical protein